VAAKNDGARPDAGLIRVARRVYNQRGVVVQEGETDHVVGRRPV